MKIPMMTGPSNSPGYSMPAHDTKARTWNGTKRILMGFVFAVASIAPHGRLAAAGPEPVDLGSAAHFTVLAGAAITTTGEALSMGMSGSQFMTHARSITLRCSSWSQHLAVILAKDLTGIQWPRFSTLQWPHGAARTHSQTERVQAIIYVSILT